MAGTEPGWRVSFSLVFLVLLRAVARGRGRLFRMRPPSSKLGIWRWSLRTSTSPKSKPPSPLIWSLISQTATGVRSTFLFTWEGQTPTGELAHIGNHEPQVPVGEVSQNLSVQVNRKQGRQPWLKLGTQTLAYLSHFTMMGSLGYALLPGVAWQTILGESAAGEKVVLGVALLRQFVGPCRACSTGYEVS